MLTKFETKSARVKGSEEEEEGNNGSWMLGDGGMLSPREREWEDSLAEWGLLEEPRGSNRGRRVRVGGVSAVRAA